MVQRNEGQAAWGCGAQQKEEELTKVSLKNTAECRKALEWLLFQNFCFSNSQSCPLRAQSSQEPPQSKLVTSHCASPSLCCCTHSVTGRAPPQELPPDGTQREVNVFPSSISSHLGSQTQPEMGAVRSSFSLVLHSEIVRAPVEGHHAGTGRTEFSLLEFIQTRIHLLFPQQEALSSYHYNNECLQGYIASFIITHPCKGKKNTAEKALSSFLFLFWPQ